MNIVQIVFSPTGGTQRVADVIAAEGDNIIRKIDLTNADADYSALCLGEDELAVIAVPSYGGRVPALAAERLTRIHGSQALCVLVCVYGNRAYEDTLVELYDIVRQCDFRVIAAISAIAEHSIMHQYATGRPDQNDENELHRFTQKIFSKINDSAAYASELQIPGNRPYKKSGSLGLVPKKTKNCTSCGLCAKNCPAQAISRDSLKADPNKCVSCMRCVTQCPQSARKLNDAMVSAAALVMKKACSGRKANELFL